LKHEFTISVPVADLDAKAHVRLDDIRGKIRLNGFRPGKVPVAHVKKLYGRHTMMEVLEETIRLTNEKVITERGFRLATEPKVKLVPEDSAAVEDVLSGKADLVYTVTVELVPSIELVDFKDFKVEKLVAEVSEEELAKALERIAESYRSFTDRGEGGTAQLGDRVTISFTGRIDGELFDTGASNDEKVVLGSKQYLAGFEEQLVGIAANETRILKCTFPAEYGNATLAGKDAEFETTASLIESPNELKIDDSFAQTLGMDSLERLRQAAKDRLLVDYAAISRRCVKRALLDRLDETHRFEVPPSLVEAEFEQMWQAVTGEMKAGGKTFADENTTEEEALAEYRAIANRRVRLGLVLAEIASKNKIDVTTDELNRVVAEQARRLPGREKEVWEYFRSNSNALAGIRAPLLEEKVVDFILELANVTERTVSLEELVKADEEATKTGLNGLAVE